jgi:TonB-like protein
MVASHAHNKFILASLCVLLFSASTFPSQESWPKVFDDCRDRATLMRKRNGKIRWFLPKEMGAMAINRSTPPFPPMCRCQGTVIVAVIVNRDGAVECSHVISGHPLLSAASIQAANKWTFRPLMKRGSKFSFVGLLAFTFHSSGEVTY